MRINQSQDALVWSVAKLKKAMKFVHYQSRVPVVHAKNSQNPSMHFQNRSAERFVGTDLGSSGENGPDSFLPSLFPQLILAPMINIFLIK